MLRTAHILQDAAPETARADQIDWREQAACAPFRWDPEDDPFFPSKGATGGMTEARVLCGGCPVLEDCREDALQREPVTAIHGFRAGLTADERKSIRRRVQRDAAKARAEAATAADAAEAVQDDDAA